MRPTLTASLLALPLALLAAGCAHSPDPAATPPGTAHADHAATPTAPPAGAKADAVVQLRTADGRNAGRASLTQGDGGVHLQLDATGLAPGQHGFHIHSHGECAPGPDAATGRLVPFGAAGGHFDPGNTRNHGHPGDAKTVAHAGELPNLTADGSGKASLHYLNTQVTLSPGPASVMGRTLIVHADPDDYQTDPAGNSGGRVLCGIIEPAQAGAVTGRTTFQGANVFPEGIAFDPATGDRYVGSVREGHLYRLAPGAAQAEVLQHGGSPGRQGAFGLKVDERRKLWVAGGPHGTVAVVDIATATTEAVLKAPPGQQPFLNDLVVAGPAVYVTDSYRPVIYRIARGTLPLVLEPWLDLNTTAVRYRPNEVNLNGIVASADGRWLLSVQLNTGQLWRIDTRARAVTEVTVTGGSLLHGDGLALRGATELYVVRNEDNEIARVDLSADWSSGRVTQRLRDPRFKYPTTAAVVPQGLSVVNGQLDRQKEPPPLLPFDVMTIGLPQPAAGR